MRQFAPLGQMLPLLRRPTSAHWPGAIVDRHPRALDYQYPYYVCMRRVPLIAGHLVRCPARRVRADRLAAARAPMCELVLTPERLAARFGRGRERVSLEDGVLEWQIARLCQLTPRQGQQERQPGADQRGVITLDELAARREQLARQQVEVDAQGGATGAYIGHPSWR